MLGCRENPGKCDVASSYHGSVCLHAGSQQVETGAIPVWIELYSCGFSGDVSTDHAPFLAPRRHRLETFVTMTIAPSSSLTHIEHHLQAGHHCASDFKWKL